MKNLLFLAHRIPYPPNKGDKIRSYHFLKGLSESYHIHLATFIDDENDWHYVDKVKAITTNVRFEKLDPKFAKVKSLLGFVKQQPLTLPYYQSVSMQNWIDQTIQAHHIQKIFVFSSAMAQFVQAYQNLDIIIDFVDVDSDKWLQYSQKSRWPMNWIYQREAKQLLAFDRQAASEAKKSIFVSETESHLFERLTDHQIHTIDYVNNGVDTDYFQINNDFSNPYPENQKIIVFTGAMDYWANVDAVKWFAETIFPKVRQQEEDACFYIVGSNPSQEVLDLADHKTLFVTGRVEDIRPYLQYAAVVVAPLLIARGIQNKVLEAMAMEKPIVATSQAIEGIHLTDQAVAIMNEPEPFAGKVLNYLQDCSDHCFRAENRQFIEQTFSWSANLEKLKQIIN